MSLHSYQNTGLLSRVKPLMNQCILIASSIAPHILHSCRMWRAQDGKAIQEFSVLSAVKFFVNGNQSSKIKSTTTNKQQANHQWAQIKHLPDVECTHSILELLICLGMNSQSQWVRKRLRVRRDSAVTENSLQVVTGFELCPREAPGPL